jgi:hypothetical protein
MIAKARDNVEATRMLLGLGWQFPDAAANRLYYAVYQAGWAFLRKCGRSVPLHKSGRYFQHEEMEDLLIEEGFQSKLSLEPDWDEDWATLRGLRVKADYLPDSVGLEDLSADLFEFADEVISKVSGLKGPR